MQLDIAVDRKNRSQRAPGRALGRKDRRPLAPELWLRRAALLPGLKLRRSKSVVDETAVTLRLAPLRWHQRFVPEALRWAGAAASVAAVAGGLLFFSGSSEAARVKSPAASTEPMALANATAPAFDTVLASGLGPGGPSQLFGLREPPYASLFFEPTEVEEIIIIEDDEDEDEIVILDDLPDPVPVIKMSPAKLRAEARRLARAHFDRGNRSHTMGRATVAERHFEAALAAIPTYSPAAAALAELHIKRRDHDAALQYAKRASRGEPDNREYLLLLGDAYLLKKNHRAARKAWRQARRLRS